MLVNSLRKILYPLSLIYGCITRIRNYAFDHNILKSRSFEVPIIAVGNLNMGGTGKTPMVEYLLSQFHESCKTAVLSRGYGRKTKGFVLAGPNSSSSDLGDEPLQYFKKYKDVAVAVDEERVRGIEKLLGLTPDLELVLLDDAFQHRYVRAGYYILLTSYGDLYTDDLLLPAGNLRESKKGAERSDCIIITKCPSGLSGEEQSRLIKKLNPLPLQRVYFSRIAYGKDVIGAHDRIPVRDLGGWNILLVTGIANSKPMEEFLREKGLDFEKMNFGDHHYMGKKELSKIQKGLESMAGPRKIILTTEKDYVRSFADLKQPVYYLPIRTEFISGGETFNESIQNYVRKNKGNG